MNAPTTTIETVSVVRPLKVIALLCLIVAVVVQIVAILTTFWLKSGPSRFGLFEECTSKDTFGGARVEGGPLPGECQGSSHDRVYIKAVAALLCISTILVIATAVCTIVGLNSKNFSVKYLFYRIALYISLFAVLLDLIALLTFPICFYLEMKQLDRLQWEFDWSYGMAWGSTLFTFGAALLLICDKEHEEVYYKEKVRYASLPGDYHKFDDSLPVPVAV